MMVLFRFKFKFTCREDVQLLHVYKDKWRALTRYAMTLPRSRETYERLFRLKQGIARDFTFDDVIQEVMRVNNDGARLLIDCHPLFDRSSFDYKTYLLALIGCENLK